MIADRAATRTLRGPGAAALAASRAPEAARDPAIPALALQQALGNQALAQRVAACPAFSACPTGGACHPCPFRVQTKLAVSRPGDPYEREADRVADAVMRMPDDGGRAEATGITRLAAEPGLQRETADEDEEEEPLQAKERPGAIPGVTPGAHAHVERVRGGGRPLDPATRAFFEPRLGRDLGGVRVHADAAAATAAEGVRARAFTVGRDVFFGAGEYAPATTGGRRLLAHELTHVIQQGSADRPPPSSARGARGARVGHEPAADVVLRSPARAIQRAVPTGIKVKEAKPFGHADLDGDELKKKWRTYMGAVTLMQVTPAGDYKGHCAKESLTEVANTCPARFAELRAGDFCTGAKCLQFGQYEGKSMGDGKVHKSFSDGPDTFIDLHRTRNPASLLEGTGKDKCSVVCHQRYKYDGKTDLGSFYIIRNFRAGKYTPAGSKDALHITTGEVQKVPAALEAPTAEKFAKDVAPGLVKKGVLAEAPTTP